MMKLDTTENSIFIIVINVLQRDDAIAVSGVSPQLHCGARSRPGLPRVDGECVGYDATPRVRTTAAKPAGGRVAARLCPVQALLTRCARTTLVS